MEKDKFWGKFFWLLVIAIFIAVGIFCLSWLIIGMAIIFQIMSILAV